MDDTEKALYGCIGITLTSFISIVLGTIINGFVLMILWDWFIVSLFEYPSLSLSQAIGLSLVVGYLTKQYIYTEDKRSSLEKTIFSLIMLFLWPGLTLLIGYIVSIFL